MSFGPWEIFIVLLIVLLVFLRIALVSCLFENVEVLLKNGSEF